MLREIQELWNYHSQGTIRFAEHDVYSVFQKAIRDLKTYGFGGLRGQRVLDLGCGQRYSLALQCAAAGAEVSALDIDYVQPDFLPLAFYRTLKHNGAKRALKSAVRRVLFDGHYYRYLEMTSGEQLLSCRSSISFIVSDPTTGNYPLPSNTFDLIISNAVLEHVADVPKFAQEVARLLAPGGYFYAVIHNYCSLSGGHNLEWAFPDEHPSSTVPPWDHLRENRFPAFTYLNRYKPEDYQHAFGNSLQILLFEGRDINHDPGGREGERFLTDDLETELADYPKELLLTRAWCIVCIDTT